MVIFSNSLIVALRAGWVRPNSRVPAEIDPLFIGIRDPRNVMLRQRVMKERRDQHPDHDPECPFQIHHRPRLSGNW